jgi:hypothetical protein
MNKKILLLLEYQELGGRSEHGMPITRDVGCLRPRLAMRECWYLDQLSTPAFVH